MRWRDIQDYVLIIGIILVIVGTIAGLRVLHAHMVYGDWRCAIAECRRMVK